MPEVGGTDLAQLTVSPADGTTAAALTIFAPDGTSSAGSPSTTNSGATWTAPVTYTVSGWWLFEWTVTGTGANVKTERVFVDGGAQYGGPPLYVSLDLFRAQLRIDNHDRDEALLLALSGASRTIDRECSRRFYLDTEPVARTYELTGRVDRRRDYSDLLLIDDLSTLSGVTVENLSGAADAPTASVIPTGSYRAWPDNATTDGVPIEGLVGYRNLWGISGGLASWIQPRVRVTGIWGWPRVPDEIAQATLIQATRYYLRKDSPQGIAGAADWGAIRLATLDPDVRLIISNYQRPGFGGGG